MPSYKSKQYDKVANKTNEEESLKSNVTENNQSLELNRYNDE